MQKKREEPAKKLRTTDQIRELKVSLSRRLITFFLMELEWYCESFRIDFMRVTQSSLREYCRLVFEMESGVSAEAALTWIIFSFVSA